jgi:hypothetical protein
MNIPYQTIFDANAKGFELWPTAVSLLCGLIFLSVARSKNTRENFNKMMLTYSLAGLGFLFALIIFVLMYRPYREILSAYRSGKCEVVEGKVSDFHPKPTFGGGYESFRVRDVQFFYSDYESTPGFNRTTRNGGTMTEGLPVRITYVYDNENSPNRNVIVKLEIAQTPR